MHSCDCKYNIYDLSASSLHAVLACILIFKSYFTTTTLIRVFFCQFTKYINALIANQ